MATAKKNTKKSAAKNSKKTDAAKNGESKSSNVLRRPFLISVGALALAEEKATELIDSLIEKGEEATKAGEKYLKKVGKNSAKKSSGPAKSGTKKKNKKKSAPNREDIIKRALGWLNIPTLDEVEKLDKKVDSILKRKKKVA